MTGNESNAQLLPGADFEDLTAPTLGKLIPVLRLGDGAVPAAVLDTFDAPLERAGQVLLAAQDGWLELVMPDGRICAQQGAGAAAGGFVADLPDGPVTRELAGLSPLRALLPVGRVRLWRGVLALVDNEGKTRARAHLRRLAASGGEDVLLAALQGLRGYDKAFAALVAHVAACGGVALREGALCPRLFPGYAPYVAKPAVPMAAADDAFDAATASIAAHLPVARANEAGIVADHDTEFLHDYRIALRKIRSVLSLFKGVYAPECTEDLKARFLALMAPTGRLRDLDVYLLERHCYYDLLPESLHAGLDRLFALLAEERTAEHKRQARRLRGKKYRAEVAALESLFAAPERLERGAQAGQGAHDYACRLIWKRYRRICRIAADIGTDTPDDQVHRLRIHCKKLRYLMEFFAPIFPARAFKRLIKPLKRLQDNLGLFNDYSVQQESLRSLLQRREAAAGGTDLELAQSVGALIAVLHARQRQERARVVESFRYFDSAETQATFRKLFHQRKDKP